MTNDPVVSVIIPNYNHASFLDERIQSVLNQTYQNFEVIILDDKSTDNSLKIINKYKNNPHISQIVVNEINSGSPFKQWHKGFELAKGELIWIAESDDSCSPAFLERIVPTHQIEKAVLSFCRSQSMDEKSRLYQTWHNEVSDSFVMEGKDFIEKFLGKYNLVTNASSAIFNKEAACIIDKSYASFKGAGDWLFWIELAQKGTVCFCSEALNYFRKHSTNTTQKSYLNGVDYFEGKKILNYLVENRLISKKTETWNRKEHLKFVLYKNFENEEIRKELLRIWGYNKRYQVKYFCSRVLHKIESLLWR